VNTIDQVSSDKSGRWQFRTLSARYAGVLRDLPRALPGCSGRLTWLGGATARGAVRAGSSGPFIWRRPCLSGSDDVRLVQMRAGEGLRQNRGAVAVFVMLAAVAAVAMMAGARSNTAPTGHAALGAMTAEEANQLFRNAKPLGYPHAHAPSSHLRPATLPAPKLGPNPARASSAPFDKRQNSGRKYTMVSRPLTLRPMARLCSDYEEWTKSIDDINAEGKINHGVWTPFTGPPFMQATILQNSSAR